ncbi:hypothetical protein A2W15_03900 [Candidatus Woesebacteria bacterium RBG_16_41_13]|nr:MAG: hypothetical protein A2W15_03900 [Candidatus Woesebacteria bacterium RBG_16_41_13]
MLTIKSDDIVGRARAFEAIVKGDPIPEANVPESFKVLVRELNSLGMALETIGAVIADEAQKEENEAVQSKEVVEKKL